MPVALTPSSTALPWADGCLRADPSTAAQGRPGMAVDIGELLVEHPQTSFLLRVAGPAMSEYGIEDGDMLVVDRALPARDGSIVVAVVDHEFTVKALCNTNGVCTLKAGNAAHADIVCDDNPSLEIWGVVTSCIKRFA